MGGWGFNKFLNFINMLFKTPLILLLAPLAMIAVIWLNRKQQSPALRFPSAAIVSCLPKTWKNQFSRFPFYLRLLALVLFIVAFAGPRTVFEETTYKAEGIDIMLAIDASRSLAAEDFKLNGKRYNRLEVIKDVVKEFIDGRANDRIGIVAFAGLAYTVSPLTKDYTWLKANLDRIKFDLIKDGTAIGSAINSSLIRLRDSDAKSKVMILLTDGVNNSGKTDPLAAAEAAKAKGVKIYAIGAGRKGHAPYPVQNMFGQTVYRNVKTDVDEETLKKIASITNGKYFRATDTAALRKIYKEIDELEKTEIEELGYHEYQELFGYVLAFALLLILLEQVLSNTVLLKLP